MSSEQNGGEQALPAVSNSELSSEANIIQVPHSIDSARRVALSIPTPKRYIELKNEFPYVKSNYVADIFWKLFPNHKVRITHSETFDKYWFLVDVEIEVTMSNGDVNVQCGTGGSRIQISKKAKEAFLEDGTPITPFDYVEVGNARKAALTLAIKNAQEKFGIGHDALNKIVLSDEEVEQINTHFKSLLEQVVDPRQKSKINSSWSGAKSLAEKFRIIEHLKEITE